MLPTVISHEIELGIKSFLRTKFPTSTPAFEHTLEKLKPISRVSPRDLRQWDEVRSQQSDTVHRTVTDTTLPTGAVEREIIWHVPFTRCDREQNFAEVWGEVGGERMKVEL